MEDPAVIADYDPLRTGLFSEEEARILEVLDGLET